MLTESVEQFPLKSSPRPRLLRPDAPTTPFLQPSSRLCLGSARLPHHKDNNYELLLYSPGPIVGILGQKYGARPVSVIGAIIAAFSAGMCFFARDILWITVLWGALSGVGAALATTLNQAVIGQHFKKYRTTAAGMAFSGGCIGSFLFPVLLEYFLLIYGLQGTFLIMSGILMHVIPGSMLLRKPRWLNKQNSQHQIPTISGNKVKNVPITHEVNDVEKNVHRNDIKVSSACQVNAKANSFTKVYEKKCSTVQNDQLNSLKKINKDILWENRKYIINLLEKILEENASNSRLLNETFSTENNDVKEIEDIFNKMVLDVYNNKNTIKHVSSDSIIAANCSNSLTDTDNDSTSEDFQRNDSLKLRSFELTNINKSSACILSNALKNLFESSMMNTVETSTEVNKESITKIFNELRHVYNLLIKYSEKAEEDTNKRSNSFYSHIKTAINLYTKPIFLLICLCRAAHMMIIMPLFTTIVDFSMDKGLPKEDGKYVIGALSFGDLLGRLCLGWISDRGYINLPKFMMIGMILQGAFLAVLSVMYSKATLLSAIAACGVLQGSLFVRHPVLINRYLTSHEQSIGMGCLNFFSGLLSFAMPIYIGYFRDVIGSYNGILYINGAVAAFVGLLWGFESYIVNLSRQFNKKNVPLQ